MFERLFEDLRLQRLLAEQSMQLSNLALQGPVIRRRNDLLAAAGRRQGALSDETTPGEELVGSNPMPTRYQAHGGAGFKGLLDHADLLRGRPAPTPLNRGDDFNAILRIGHDTIVCLTLAKWETVSGRFGGYLTYRPEKHLARSTDRGRPAPYLLRGEEV